ncbi:MAG TPA: winged helix-turn-helix transcriptional regulator [Candidatus Bathyarchaeia archaeon]|nr:winged helix-turn-helix transcriptional regulator [Candidatus Bathyarchaeia archaeon]
MTGVRYQMIENVVISMKCPIFYLQIRQNSKTFVLVCPLVQSISTMQETIKNYIDYHEPCSLTTFENVYTSFSEDFTRMVGEEPNENTEKVLRHIQANPGSHLRMIQKELNMSMGTTQYHLELLEKMGKITSEKDSFQRFYFPVGSFGNVERNILKILNQENARDILLLIIEKKNPTQTDIVNGIKISAGTANWHISKLLELNIIREEREGKFKRYSFNGNPGILVNMMKNYHTSIWNTWSARMAELFISASFTEGKK